MLKQVKIVLIDSYFLHSYVQVNNLMQSIKWLETTMIK